MGAVTSVVRKPVNACMHTHIMCRDHYNRVIPHHHAASMPPSKYPGVSDCTSAKDTTTAFATTQTAGGVIWWMQIQISMASRLVRGASRNQPYYITQTHDLMTDSDRKYVLKHAITQGLD